MKRSTSRALAAALLLGACSDSDPSGSGGEVAAHDAGGDAPGPNAGPGDWGPGDLPLAWAWADPTRVEAFEPERVGLEHIGDPDGRLSGPFAHVDNCINREGGISARVPIGGEAEAIVSLCVIEQTVTPDPDGDYLSIVAPEDLVDPDDPFAEVQMWFHLNRILAYFRGAHGTEPFDPPLRALVNLQVALTIGGTQWLSIDNAAFIPADALAGLSEELGVELPFDEDLILFAQGPEVDMAYDGDVVYHETTHAVIGGERLTSMRVDRYGVDMAPFALHEGLADYFTSSLTDDPRMGGWALGKVGAPRDLSVPFRCPDALIGESHHDGRVFASAAWGVRALLGAEVADALVYDALLTFHERTNFEEAAEAMVAAAARLDPPEDDRVQAVFEEHGIPGCDRVRPLGARGVTELPVVVPGTQGSEEPAFESLAPAHVQLSFSVQDRTRWVRLRWELASASGGGVLDLLSGGSDPPNLSVALRQGQQPILWSYPDEGATPAADAVLPATLDGERYSVSVAGSCLQPGTHVMQFISTSSSGGTMRAIKVDSFLGEAPEDEAIQRYDCPR
jgi:hypothetical protein